MNWPVFQLTSILLAGVATVLAVFKNDFSAFFLLFSPLLAALSVGRANKIMKGHTQ